MRHTNTHILARAKKILSAWTVACMVLTLVRGPSAMIETASAASSFRPTIFVNTEAFLIIDDDDTSSDVVMRFGDTLAKTLSFNRSLDRFEFNDDVYTSGKLTASGTIVTESGAYIDGNTFVVQAGSNNVGIGTATPLADLHVMGSETRLDTGTTNGATSLSFVDGGSEKAHVSIDQNTATFDIASTNRITIGSSDYVTISGSNYTNIQGSTTFAGNNVGIGKSDPKTRLDVVGAISGSFVYATRSFSGAGLTDCDTGATSKLLWDATTGRFSCGTDTDTNTTYTAGQGLSLNGTSFRLNDTVTGSVIKATTSLASSGTIVWEGKGSGASLHVKDFLAVGSSQSGSLLTVGRVGSGIIASTSSNATLFSTDQMALGQLEGGAVFGRVRLTENQWGLANYSNTWTAKESNRNWNGVAMSSDGKFQTAVATGGQIYVSNDYGNTWTAKESNRNWNNVAMSSDGKFQAAAPTGAQIYVSSDYGNTWTAKDSSRSWYGMSMSSDGKVMAATHIGGRIYISKDYGNTWTAKESNRSWSNIAMSSDGKIMTTVIFAGKIYISTNYGDTWTAKDSDRDWYDIAMSSDGRIQASVVSDGQIFVSVDYGNTWTAKESTRNWYSIAMSSDGKILAAPESGGQIYASTDYGNTWAPNDSNKNWSDIAMSSDGKVQTGIVFGGQIHISHADSYQYGSVAIGTGSVKGNAKLMVQGVLSGVTLYATKSFSGAGLTDCDGGTSKLLWDATTGRFSCGTVTSTTYTAGQGLNLNGANAFALNTTITGSLVEFTTVSGATVKAQSQLTSSGTIVTESGAYIDGTTFVVQANNNRVGIGTASPQAALHIVASSLTPDVLIADSVSSAGTLHITNANAGTTTTDGLQIESNDVNAFITNRETGNLSFGTSNFPRMLIDAGGNVGISKTDPKVRLDVVGAISGSFIYATRSFSGAGLSDCDTAGTSKLLWDATTGRFSCGTDQGASYTAGQGLTLNGTSFSLNAAITGSTVKTSGSISASGSLLAVGNITTKSGAVVTRHGVQFLSGGSLNFLNGFNAFMNAPTGGVGTDGWSRLSNQGNLHNIGSIQAGQTHLRRGGTFTSATNYTTGVNPGGVAIGDLNGDGYADMAVTNISGNSISIFLNTGTGGLAAKTDYSTGSNAQIVVIKDVNGDGKPDVMSANNSSMSVFMNKGDGTFKSAVNYGAGFISMAAGDVNGDGTIDIVGVSYANPSLASVYLNNGKGAFALDGNYSAGTFAAAVAIGDINGDSRPDLATTGFITNQVYVMLNTGTGAFHSSVSYSGPGNSTAIAIGDVNGDNKGDIVTGGNTVSVLLNTGTGSMATKVDYSGGSVSVAIGDLNGDGMPDIASANGGSAASIYLNNGNGTYAAKTDYTTGSTTKGVAIGDLNGDGKAEVATTRNGSSAVAVIANEARTILFAGTGTGGAVGIGTSTPGSSLSVSGSVLIGRNIANSSAKALLDVRGIMSGVTLYATRSFSGAGLSDCDTAGTSKLLWDATTGRFSCGTDQGASYTVGQGLSLNGTSFRLNATVTGSVIQAGTTLASSGSLSWKGTATGSILNAGGGSMTVSRSGSTVFNELGNPVDFRIEGDTDANLFFADASTNRIGIGIANALQKLHIYSAEPAVLIEDSGSAGASVFLKTTNGQWNVSNDGAGNFQLYDSDVGQTRFLIDGAGKVGIGTALPRTKLEVVGAISGSFIYATQSFSGAGLSDCDNTTTSKLLWDATTGRFSCGTDQTGGSSLSYATASGIFLKRSGGTMTGALNIQSGNSAAATLATLLNVRGTMSGKSLTVMGTGATALLSTTTGKPTVRIGGSGSLVIETRSSDPGSAPANTVGVFAQKTAGRPMLMQASGATMAATALQTALFGNQIMTIKPGGGSTLTAEGTQALNDTTVSHPASDQVFGFMANFATAAVSGDDAGTSSSNTVAFRGSTAGANGFFYMTRVGVVDTTSIRVYSGMADQTIATMVGADNPTGNHVGFQFSTPRGDTNWQFTTKDNSTQNVVNTGMAFSANKVYDLYFMCTKQCAAIVWEIHNVTDGTKATGTTSSNLPTTTAALRMVLGVESQTTTAKNIRMQQMYFESDR